MVTLLKTRMGRLTGGRPLVTYALYMLSGTLPFFLHVHVIRNSNALEL